jgi:TolB protein
VSTYVALTRLTVPGTVSRRAFAGSVIISIVGCSMQIVPMRLLLLFGGVLAASLLSGGCGGGSPSESYPLAGGSRSNGLIAVGDPTGNEIDVMGAHGRRPRRLVRYGASPAWSPDGKRLAYVGSDANFNPRLYVTNADGRDKRRLPVDFDADYQAGSDVSWSPDGRKIAFDGGPGGEDHIYELNAEGGGLRQLTRAHEDTSPAWSPDGKKIAFVRGISSFDIYVMKADGSEQRKLAAGDSPTWSPNGATIAFDRGGGAYSGESGGLYAMNADGSNQHRLGNGTSPAWSPDGKLIAFFCCSGYATSGNGIYVVDAAGGRLRRLARFTAGPVSLSWQPLASP